MSYSIYTKAITDKTQADGDQTVDVSGSYKTIADSTSGGRKLALDNWQGHFEIRLAADDTAHTPSAGTANIYGVPKGGTEKGKILLAEIDLTSTATLGLMDGWQGVFDSIIVSPDSLDADCEYDFIMTAW